LEKIIILAHVLFSECFSYILAVFFVVVLRFNFGGFAFVPSALPAGR
jgi:hypothetical protein